MCVLFLVLVAAVSVRVQAPKTVWDGVYTEEQSTAGEAIFTKTCAECHGDDLAGREQAPALAGEAFTDKWKGATLKRLLDTVQQMPPDAPESLSVKQYVQAVAYLLHANEFPSGQTALPEDRGALTDIQIAKTRPQK